MAFLRGMTDREDR